MVPSQLNSRLGFINPGLTLINWNIMTLLRLSGALKKRHADELQHSGLNVQDGEGMDTEDVAKSEKPVDRW